MDISFVTLILNYDECIQRIEYYGVHCPLLLKEWVERKGDDDDLNSLAHCYLHSEGCTADLAKAAALYKQSCEAGSRQGQTNYGQCLVKGTGVRKNEKLGQSLIEEAADYENGSDESDDDLICINTPPEKVRTAGPTSYMAEEDMYEETYEENRCTLKQAFAGSRRCITYEYESGESWYLSIEQLSSDYQNYSDRYIYCVCGSGACPPDDCEGTDSYNEFLLGLDNSYAAMSDLIQFDPAEANSALREMEKMFVQKEW